MSTIKAYNGIAFYVKEEEVEFGYTLVSLVKFASKDEAEKELERALFEFAKDEPMLDFRAVSAELESGEILEITLRGPVQH